MNLFCPLCPGRISNQKLKFTWISKCPQSKSDFGAFPYRYRFQISLTFLAWSFLTIFSLLWRFQENILESFYWEFLVFSRNTDPNSRVLHITRNRSWVIIFNNSQRKDLVWVDFRKLGKESGDSFPFREKGCFASATHISSQRRVCAHCAGLQQEKLPCRRGIL